MGHIVNNKPSKMTDSRSVAPSDITFYEALDRLLEDDTLNRVEKFQNFAKYVPRQYLTYFLAKYEIFKKILNVHGSIVECGVFQGGSLLAYAQLSAIFEPVNHQRRVIGFDTFDGFQGIAPQDHGAPTDHAVAGGLATHAADEIRRCASVFDLNRSIAHIPKIEVVEGDVTTTVPEYLEANPHLIIALLVLDMDVYEPTKTVLRHFLPRIPSGGIILFDELNAPQWPGETRAVIEAMGLSTLQLQRFPWDSHSCFAVMK
jgi:hypothetical protein